MRTRPGVKAAMVVESIIIRTSSTSTNARSHLSGESAPGVWRAARIARGWIELDQTFESAAGRVRQPRELRDILSGLEELVTIAVQA